MTFKRTVSNAVFIAAFMTIVLAALIALPLSACADKTKWIIEGVPSSSDTGGISDSTGDTGGLKTLAYMAPSWITADEEAKDAMYTAIEDFKNTHAGTEVNLEFVAWEDIITRFPIAFQANESPDIVMINDIALRANILNNRFYPLDALIGEPLIDDWPEMFRTTIGMDGKIYAYPNNTTDVRVLFYNTDIFKAAGIDTDNHPELFPVTWDDLEVYAKQTSQVMDPEQYGFGFIGARTVHTPMFFSILVMQQGAMISDDKGKATFDNYESVKAAKFLASMLNPYKVTPDSVMNMDDGLLLSNFLNGRFAMILSGSWIYPQLVKEPGFHFKMCRIPRPWNGKYATISGFWAQCISLKSKNPDIAYELLLKLSNKDKTVEELFAEDMLPIRLSYMNEADRLGSPMIKAFTDIVRSDAVPSIVTEHPLDLYDVLNVALQMIWSGKPAEETLREAAKEYNEKFKIK